MSDDGSSEKRGLDPFLDGLDYPVFVVTTVDPDGGERAGCLIGFATQCSIGPERFLACLSQTNATFRVALRATHLAVHGLGRGQRDLAELFGTCTGDEVDKFARCDWEPGPGGVPLLTRCARRFVGRVVARFDVGDHVGFLLESPDGGFAATGTPEAGLLMFSDVADLEPGHDP